MLADVAPQEFARPGATEIGDRPFEERTHVIDSQAIRTAHCIFSKFSHRASLLTRRVIDDKLPWWFKPKWTDD